MILSENYKLHKQKKYGVLILVLMDDTLRAPEELKKSSGRRVLILVLMDDTLRGYHYQTFRAQR